MKTALKILTFSFVTLALIYAPAAKAASFTLNASGGGVSLTATLTGVSLGGGKFLITGMTGTLAGFGTITAIDPNPNSNGDPFEYFVVGKSGYWADNVLYLAGGADNDDLGGGANSYLDNYGLVFYVGGNWFDLFYSTDDGGFYGLLYNDGKSFLGPADVSVTPEPVTLMLFGTGLAGIVGLVRRKLRA